MKDQITNVVKLTAIALLVSQSSVVQAAYWDEQIGGYSASNNQITPGMTTTLSATVCAQRNSNSTIPISFYYSLTPNVSGSSTYLGSASGSITQPGPFCSPVVNKTVTLPTTTHGTCFSPFGGYFIFKAGSDEKSTPVGVIGGNAMPTIQSFSPASGHPGSVIHLTGDNYDSDTTAVFIGDVEAARGFELDVNGNITGIFAIVPEGATSDRISVKQISNGYPLCGGSESLSSVDFIVTPAPNYCVSSALYDGYGKIDYVQTKNFTDNFISDPACGGYGYDSSRLTYTSQGTAGEQVNLQFGTCGAPDYSKLFKMYVDWNNDNDFDDPGEFVVSAPSVAADTLYSLGLTVPSNAALGTTRMRLINALYYTGVVDSANDILACGSYPFGETLDYPLDIVSSNGVLTATNKALNLEFNSTGLASEGATPLINNPKRQNVKIKPNFIDKTESNLPPVIFSYPEGSSKK